MPSVNSVGDQRIKASSFAFMRFDGSLFTIAHCHITEQ
jgi:hypothetical protein